jgi:glycosyltransferase involved in cell wall biosynthesis
VEKEPLYQTRFDSLGCCVIIPTFNNYATLKRILDEVLSYTSNVLVINDGSTDGTAVLLENYTSCRIFHINQNRGKGNALKTGFKEATRLGYKQAITMDSDGQHYPDDLPIFLQALEARRPQQPELLIIGSRKMDDPSVPERSSFGNRCSSFWYWVETGIKLQDTQCGYRSYPLEVIKDLNLLTSRFELEIEIIVKAAWRGVEVINLPVKVLYDPRERISHFRPLQDVARITLLNIWFVGVAIFKIYPGKLSRMLTGKKDLSGKENIRKKLPLD